MGDLHHWEVFRIWKYCIVKVCKFASCNSQLLLKKGFLPRESSKRRWKLEVIQVTNILQVFTFQNLESILELGFETKLSQRFILTCLFELKNEVRLSLTERILIWLISWKILTGFANQVIWLTFSKLNKVNLYVQVLTNIYNKQHDQIKIFYPKHVLEKTY